MAFLLPPNICCIAKLCLVLEEFLSVRPSVRLSSLFFPSFSLCVYSRVEFLGMILKLGNCFKQICTSWNSNGLRLEFKRRSRLIDDEWSLQEEEELHPSDQIRSERWCCCRLQTVRRTTVKLLVARRTCLEHAFSASSEDDLSALLFLLLLLLLLFLDPFN